MGRRNSQISVRWMIWCAIFVAIVAAAAIGAWRWMRQLVTVTEVIEGPVVQAFYSTGTISPEREFPIKAAVEGTLTQVLVDKGDRVKAGQELAVISDPALQFLADKAQAELNEKLKLADEKTSPVLIEFDAKLQATSELLEIA